MKECLDHIVVHLALQVGFHQELQRPLWSHGTKLFGDPRTSGLRVVI